MKVVKHSNFTMVFVLIRFIYLESSSRISELKYPLCFPLC